MGAGGDCTEIKILNRILRLTDQGLTYEADPRHADLLLSSMGLTASNSVATPGIKDPEADSAATKNDESSERPRLDMGSEASHGGEQKDASLCAMQSGKHVQFNEDITTYHEVPAYGSIYGRHPSLLKTGKMS